MTTLPTLEILKQHRQELLLAEVAAWLHNIGKFSEEFIFYQFCRAGNSRYRDYETFKYQHVIGIVADIYTDPTTTLDQATIQRLQDMVGTWDIDKTLQYLNQYPQFLQWLKNAQFKLPSPLDDREYALGELIEFQAYKWYRPPTPLIANIFPSGSRCTELLEASHNIASEIEKEDVSEEGKQSDIPVFASSSFGYEDEINLSSWQESRDTFIEALLSKQIDEKLFRETLITALGATQRPINDVTLWDLSASVAAYYKAALATVILKDQWTTRDALRWRLLRVNFDVLGLYAKAVKIADLLAYQHAVDEACVRVKQLVEEEYPLGNEVYRDTTGLYFTFPDLELPAELAQEIRRRVEAAEPELAPRIDITVGKDGAPAQEQLKGILGKARREARNDLAQPFDAHNLSPYWQQEWETVGAGRWEVCPVCRLRPKLESDEVCNHCNERRKPRLQAWRDRPQETIWLGEIADGYDRVALLAGKFGLDDWLSGDLVQTMLVKAAENNPAECKPKNPSPARLRRVWETCQSFWQKTALEKILIQKLKEQRRKHITPDKTNWQAGLYNGKVNGKPIDLFWQPEHNAFLTVSNLQAAGELDKGDTITLEHPDTKQKAEFQIRNIREAPAPFDHYQPFLPLHASPDQFLALVPAADALEIVGKIRKQYKKQFGKVRNRLPLALGLVFFERKMPLMAVMDAARQMLDRPSRAENWQVQAKTDHNPTDEDWPRAVQLTLTCKDESIPVKVPTVMGDDKTKDLWYPYWRVEGKPTNRTRWFIGPNGEHWVHVNELKQGDIVQFTPSFFDFEFLDAAARRFEIHYDDHGRRPARPSRPFYLEDLKHFDTLWQEIRHLSKTQFKQTLQTIETTRERWFGPDAQEESAVDPTFEKFVTDTLATAAWPKEHRWKDNIHQKELIEAGRRGILTDLAELHLEILKEDLQENKKQGEPS